MSQSRSNTQDSTQSSGQIKWFADVIDNYRLSRGDCLRFLRSVYGQYTDEQFNVQFSPSTDEKFTFNAPGRRLTETEKSEEVESFRAPRTR